MTPSETAELLGLAAAFDRRTVGKADVLAWQTILADIDYTAARNAVTAHYGTETRWIMPADIRQHVLNQRADTAADIQGPGLPAEIPDADPDDVRAYLAAVREQRTRAADGTEKRRPVGELLAGVGRQVPRTEATPELAAVRRPGPFGVECPTCRAAIGRPCRIGQTGRERAPHEAREAAAHGRSHDPAAEEQRRRQAAAHHTQETA
ncbi:zinc finger domain-containing protein [Streptomyces tendae]|uniref:zinc finger domain-containing protein n=1 Tax=Streptomyces tendae TaxID=1932 RepID=UPI0034282891